MELADGNRLDLARLEELRELGLAADGTSYLDRAIGHFLEAIDGQVAAMQQAARAEDTARLRSTAHKAAGAALNLGLTELGEALRTVEELVVRGALGEAGAALADLARTLPADVEALEGYRRRQLSTP